MYTVCDIIHTLAVISLRESGCDYTDTVDVRSDRVDVMLDIVDLTS